jgi:transposase
MSRSLFWLSDEAWAAIAPHLPQNQPGARRVDDRRVISGIIHVLKSGCRWADVPADYGPPTTVYNRWNRWSRRGIWTRILLALTEENWVTETAMIDSSYIKVHRCAGGAKGGLEATPSGSLAVVAQPRSMRSWMSSGGRSASS